MKKLMFGLALVAVGLGVQAAQIDWQIDAKAIKAEDGSNLSGETAYLMMFESAAAASTYQGKLADGSVKLADATAAAIDSATSTYTTTKSAGKIDKRTATVSSANAGDKAYFAILVTSGDKFVLGAADQAQFYTPGDAQTGWNSNGSGGSTDVPEPTSGLLLLVGGAMIALRRKQK